MKFKKCIHGELLKTARRAGLEMVASVQIPPPDAAKQIHIHWLWRIRLMGAFLISLTRPIPRGRLADWAKRTGYFTPGLSVATI